MPKPVLRHREVRRRRLVVRTMQPCAALAFQTWRKSEKNETHLLFHRTFRSIFKINLDWIHKVIIKVYASLSIQYIDLSTWFYFCQLLLMDGLIQEIFLFDWHFNPRIITNNSLSNIFEFPILFERTKLCVVFWRTLNIF